MIYDSNLSSEKQDMTPFKKHAGLVMPMDRVNVDTDQMVPKQFLKALTREGFGRTLFYDWRYLPGEKPNPDFILNWPRYKGASVLLARANFGCGSSREHAVWAIQGAGVGAVIAHSFARIFYRNCINCGFYPIELPDAVNLIKDGDDLDIDYQAGKIRNKTRGTDIQFKPLPDFALKIVAEGGLLEHIKKSKIKN